VLAEVHIIEPHPKQSLDDSPLNLFVYPRDGDDPSIWSHVLKLPPYSFMSEVVYNMQKHVPEVPPPTYDKYDSVIKPKPNANEIAQILHGWEK
jgi:hypothetical protein